MRAKRCWRRDIGGSCWAAVVLLLLTAASGCEQPPPARRSLAADANRSGAAPSATLGLPSAASARSGLPAPRGVVLTADVGQIPDGLELVDAASAEALVRRQPLRLVEPGAEPRQRRRYPELGVAQALEVKLDIDMQVGGQRQAVPPLRAQLLLAPQAGRKGWTLRVVSVSLAAVDAERGGGQSAKPQAETAAETAATAPLLRQLERVSTTLEVMPQGALILGEPARLPVEIRQLWAGLVEALREALVSWPAEPVGVGARWRVFELGFRAGMRVLRQRDMTLTAAQPGALRIAQQLREVAIDGLTRDPALPAEVTVIPQGGHSDGASLLTLAPSQHFPRLLRSSLHTRATVVIAAQPKHNDIPGDWQPSPPTKLIIRQQIGLALIPR